MATWIGAHLRNFTKGRAGFRPEAIVIHIMDGTLIGTDSWFNDPRSTVSAHYGVGRRGELHQYVKETDSAHHAGVVSKPKWTLLKKRSAGPGFINPNFYTIGIEHEGKGLDAATWSQPMFDQSVALCAEIARRWSIPADALHIIPHCHIRSSKPDCPGKGVDLARYRAAVAALVPAAAKVAAPRSLSVRVLSAANLRLAPNTLNVPVRVLARGDTFQASGVVPGEIVKGNANWFRNAAGEHLWAGNTDQPHAAMA